MSSRHFHITRRRLAILSALVLASACSLAGPARGKIKTAPPQTTSISENELGAVNGKCPKGTSVVSGGFSVPDFFSLQSIVVRTGSVRAGKRGWLVTAAGLGGNEGRVLAHAYCDTEGLSLRARKATVNLPSGRSGAATARCRKGEGVVSGGFTIPTFAATGGPQIGLISSMRVGKRGWRVEGAHPEDTPGGPYPPAPLVAFAYCSADTPKIATRSSTVSAIPSDVAGAVVDTRCRRGTRAIAGGFRGHLVVGPTDQLGSTAISSTRLAKGRGWRHEVFAVAESGPVPFTGFAYCVKN